MKFLWERELHTHFKEYKFPIQVNREKKNPRKPLILLTWKTLFFPLDYKLLLFLPTKNCELFKIYIDMESTTPKPKVKLKQRKRLKTRVPNASLSGTWLRGILYWHRLSFWLMSCFCLRRKEHFPSPVICAS